MKPLHLIAGKNPLRPEFHYIIVRKGFVFVTDAVALIKMPANEVFGECEFAPDEELAVLATTWQKLGADKATFIVRKADNSFMLSNGLTLVMQTPAELDIRFPDYDSVLPTSRLLVDVPFIGLNPFLLANVLKALGVKASKTEEQRAALCFYGKNRVIEIKHNCMSADTRAIISSIVFPEDFFIQDEIADIL